MWNHDETQFEGDLNKVVFGAEAYNSITFGAPVNTFNERGELNTSYNGELTLTGEYEYLLCDECMERAHNYLKDFF